MESKISEKLAKYYIIHHKETMHIELTPVAAVPVHAHARGSRYQGDFEIIKSPSA